MTYERGKSRVNTLGHWPELSVAKATKAAFAFDPRAAKAATAAGSFKDVAEQWLRLYVDKKGLRSKGEIVRQLEMYVYPAWAGTPFFEIRRKTVNELLDKIADKGTSMADGVLATLRSIMNWYATRDSDYNSPIVKGMRRDPRSARERARHRTLTDDEIRAVWEAAGVSGPFGAIVKLLLLTAQRRDKVASMKRSDIEGDVWTIATEKREKGNAGALRLRRVAMLALQLELMEQRFAANEGGEASAKQLETYQRTTNTLRRTLDGGWRETFLGQGVASGRSCPHGPPRCRKRMTVNR